MRNPLWELSYSSICKVERGRQGDYQSSQHLTRTSRKFQNKATSYVSFVERWQKKGHFFEAFIPNFCLAAGQRLQDVMAPKDTSRKMAAGFNWESLREQRMAMDY
jgi:hypothetical protein